MNIRGRCSYLSILLYLQKSRDICIRQFFCSSRFCISSFSQPDWQIRCFACLDYSLELGNFFFVSIEYCCIYEIWHGSRPTVKIVTEVMAENVNINQWQIQDFPEGGTNSQSGCANLFSLPKTAWKRKNLDGGSLVPLLRFANVNLHVCECMWHNVCVCVCAKNEK